METGNKFKAGDKVFYFYKDDDGEKPVVHIVIDKERARIFYTGKENDRTCSSTPEQINNISIGDYNCPAVFIVDLDNSNRSIGWMPENQLHHCTKAAEVLFGEN